MRVRIKQIFSRHCSFVTQLVIRYITRVSNLGADRPAAGLDRRTELTPDVAIQQVAAGCVAHGNRRKLAYHVRRPHRGRRPSPSRLRGNSIA
jgi:hypothetical protein